MIVFVDMLDRLMAPGPRLLFSFLRQSWTFDSKCNTVCQYGNQHANLEIVDKFGAKDG